MSVADPLGAKWAPELESIGDWSHAGNRDRVYVTWKKQGASLGPNSLAATFALRLIGRENVEWLNDGSPDLVSAFIQIVTGGPGAKALIADAVVRDIFASVIAREDSRRPQNYGRLTVGSHIGPYLLDSLAQLAVKGWVLNQETMYADTTGVYLEWPKAGQDIINFCKARSYQGVPSGEAALLSLLVSNEFLVSGVDGVALFEIANVDGEISAAVKLAKPALLLPDGVTLASFAKSRPVEMQAVKANDPLGTAASIEDVDTRPQTSSAPKLEELDIATVGTKQKPADSAEGEPPWQETKGHQAPSEQEDGNEGESEDRVPTKPPSREEVTVKASSAESTRPANSKAAEPPPERPSMQGSKKRAKGDGGVAEAPEVKYSALLPAEISKKFRPFEAEVLGRLVHSWRTPGERNNSLVMRMCEHGMAVELKLLADFVSDPVSFLNTLGVAGWLYAAPTTPSKMVYPVPIADGANKTALCFILAHHALKKLGMP